MLHSYTSKINQLYGYVLENGKIIQVAVPAFGAVIGSQSLNYDEGNLFVKNIH